MSLLRFLWRWFVRFTAAAFLLGAGVLAFHWAKYRPRCVIVSDSQAIHFSDDGNTLITGYTGTQIGNMLQGGEGKLPIKVWDTRSGALIRSLLNDVKAFKLYEVCPTRNLVAVDLGDGTIRFADWQTGAEWSVDVGAGAVGGMWCSPRGDLLFVRIEKGTESGIMIDLAGRVTVHRFERGAQGIRFSRDGARWYFTMDDRSHIWNTATRQVEADFAVCNFFDDRWRVRHNLDDLSLMLYDGDSVEPTARIHPALPPKFPSIQSIDVELRRKIDSSRGYHFSPSGRLFATYKEPWGGINGVLEIWEAATGRQIAAFPQLQRGWAWFVNDDALMFFDRSKTPLDPVAIANAANTGGLIETAVFVDISTKSIRWQRPAQMGTLFVWSDDLAIQVTPNGTWDVFDPATGQARRTLPHPFAPDAFMMTFTDDKSLVCAYGRRRTPPVPDYLPKWITRWMHAQSGAVQILDTQAERLVFEMNTPTDSGAVISKDRHTLVSFDLSTGREPPYHFRFYDLHTKRPWFWALGGPGCMVILALLWRRWRSQRADRIPVSS